MDHPLSRRTFLQTAAGGAAAAMLEPPGPAHSQQAKEALKTGGRDRVPYICHEVSHFEVPPYEGDRYEAMVPDTLDIQERAILALCKPWKLPEANGFERSLWAQEWGAARGNGRSLCPGG
ncbi:MAG: twin-arginine translocation signal domain-containing protein [Pirellulales bacterium]|nr:twin-arginine translocation signal domain-containing protein [Pirellulales bacterium]